MGIDGRAIDGEAIRNQRQHREAMARNSPPQAPRPGPRPQQQGAQLQSGPRADAQPSPWDEADWEQTMTRRRAIARGGCCRAQARAFIGSAIGSARSAAGSPASAGSSALAIAIAALMVIFAACFGGLWWRLGAGPINLDMATPWLAAAIEENIGHGNTVEVGGTQIERAGRIRIAVRIRDIIVRDRDHAIVATRAEGRGQAIRHGAADGTASRRKPQSGRCRTRGADHARTAMSRFPPATLPGRSQPASPRSGQPARCRCQTCPIAGSSRCLRHPAAGRSRAPTAVTAERTACRPRLARQPEPDRPRRAEPQRDRPEERQPHRRRSAARQQMEVRKHQPQPSPAERRRRCAERRRRGRHAVVASRRGRPARQRRALGRYSRRQGLDHQYPAGAAAEGPDLQRRSAADRRTEGRTRPRRRCRPISAARSPPAPATSSTAIRPTIRWRSIRRK